MDDIKINMNVKRGADIAELTFCKVRPEEGVSDYVKSRLECAQPKKYPVWDVPRESPELELMQARRELAASELRLRDKRRGHDQIRVHLDSQWEELRSKEAQFRSNFVRFNKFVRENEEKRERAEKKIREETALQQRRANDILDTEERLQQMTELKQDLEQHVTTYRLYEDFLSTVVKNSSIFKNVNEILNRYEALNEARKELAESQERDLELLEKAQMRMARLVEEKQQVIMGLNNQLAEMQGRFEKARMTSLHWENAVGRVRSTAADRMTQINQVRTCCKDLYHNMVERRGPPTDGSPPLLQPPTNEDMLLHIKKHLQELSKIAAIARKRQFRDVSTARTDATASRR